MSRAFGLKKGAACISCRFLTPGCRSATGNGLKKPSKRTSMTAIALTRFESVPPTCFTFRVPNQAAAPDLQEGDYAVVDQGARDIAIDKLYLLQWTSKLRRDQPVVVCTILKVTADRMRLKDIVDDKRVVQS